MMRRVAPRAALHKEFVSGGTRRNLDWIRSHLQTAMAELLLLADAQTSGGFLIAGELPGVPVIGELVPPTDHLLIVREPRSDSGRALLPQPGRGVVNRLWRLSWLDTGPGDLICSQVLVHPP